MKKISWISCDSFIDTDLPAVQRLSQYYEILCVVIIPADSSIDYEQMVNTILGQATVKIRYVYLSHRLRSIHNIPLYINVIREAKRFHPDIYYVSYQGMPYGGFLYKALLPKNNCIAACHNVTTPQGAVNGKMAQYYTTYWLSCFKNINVFSLSQEQVLLKNYPRKRVLMTPFFPKFYGKPSKSSDKTNSEKLRFLVFGNIVEYKRIDLLIDAANILYSRGVRNFTVRIAGQCRNWSYYQSRIKHEELFELMIERIPNERIPELFADSHYAVFPYQDIAQSGSITVAFSYNVPTIVSDIPQFEEFVTKDETGLTFKSQDAISLADTMQFAIEKHLEIYPVLCEKQKKQTEEQFSETAIIDKYKVFFDEL